MVMYNDYAAGQAAGDPQTVLAKTRDGAVKGKTLLSDKVISLNGVPGREFTAKDDNWNYTVRQYLQGKRLFQLIIVSNAANPATQTSAFLNSFKIL
jgi:predicted Zn-dependent protease